MRPKTGPQVSDEGMALADCTEVPALFMGCCGSPAGPRKRGSMRREILGARTAQDPGETALMLWRQLGTWCQRLAQTGHPHLPLHACSSLSSEQSRKPSQCSDSATQTSPSAHRNSQLEQVRLLCVAGKQSATVSPTKHTPSGAQGFRGSGMKCGCSEAEWPASSGMWVPMHVAQSLITEISWPQTLEASTLFLGLLPRNKTS